MVLKLAAGIYPTAKLLFYIWSSYICQLAGTPKNSLVSKVKQGANKYESFALVFKRHTDSQKFEWLQFISRQLVVDHSAKTGSLIFQNVTVAYQLADSADEITDYTLATGSQPANWSTCWKVDSGAGARYCSVCYVRLLSESYLRKRQNINNIGYRACYIYRTPLE